MQELAMPNVRAALAVMPCAAPDWLAHFDAACTLQAQGQLPEARVALAHIVHTAPAGQVVLAPAWANLGMVLDELHEPDAARAAYEHAIALDATLYAPHLHLGQWWMDRREPGATAQAEYWLQQAARLQPHEPGVWSALGGLLTCMRRDADAEACLRHALQLDAEHVGARFNMSYLFLRQGRWAEGWACLEMRPLARSLAASLPWPRWAGEPLAGRRLLIVNDAGHGDLIQFWRWRQRLHALGAREVAWMVQPALISLLQAQAGVGPVWALDGDVPLTGPAAPDVWAPLLSLPWLCGDDGDWPDALPYLQAPEPLAMPDAATDVVRPFTIGLAWHGNPGHENDADRSLPGVDALAPLLHAVQAIEAERGVAVRVLNLQDDGHVGPAITQVDPRDRIDLQQDPALKQAWSRRLQAQPRLDGFGQVAQALQGIDLLITVDTAYAHLAAAMGRRVWVVLPHWKTDWRWLEGRDDSPWYPEVMRLFRQVTRGDWAGVIAEVAQALAAEPATLRPQHGATAPPHVPPPSLAS
jgi:tetratricopeptide (TPR) repeat protein